MKLKLNGKPLVLHPPSPVIQAIHDFLSKAPKDELYDCTELGAKLSCTPGFLQESRCHGKELLKGFTANVRGKRYYGNPAAIAELQRQVNA